jgi:hypothetical protein
MSDGIIAETIRRQGVLTITYEDAYGDETQRTIRPLRTFRSHDGRSYVEAWCELRRSKRTFRADRLRVADAPQTPKPAPATTRSYAAPREKPRGRGLLVAVLFVAAIIALNQVEWGEGSRTPTAAPAPAPPPPKDGIYALTPYRGLRIHKVVMRGKTTYEAPDWAISKPSYQQVHYEVNARKFRQATGIRDVALEARYAAADYDRNGHLAWFEIERFQGALVREFEYRNNDIALRPDHFLAAKGGDCEDFALYTAGLLRYWGWNNWIGGIYDKTGFVGHAVCLVRVGDDVPSELSYHLGPKAVGGHSSIPTGRYIPIDYATVGNLSTAADATDHLLYVWVPEEIYGTRM